MKRPLMRLSAATRFKNSSTTAGAAGAPPPPACNPVSPGPPSPAGGGLSPQSVVQPVLLGRLCAGVTRTVRGRRSFGLGGARRGPGSSIGAAAGTERQSGDQDENFRFSDHGGLLGEKLGALGGVGEG